MNKAQKPIFHGTNNIKSWACFLLLIRFPLKSQPSVVMANLPQRKVLCGVCITATDRGVLHLGADLNLLFVMLEGERAYTDSMLVSQFSISDPCRMLSLGSQLYWDLDHNWVGGIELGAGWCWWSPAHLPVK